MRLTVICNEPPYPPTTGGSSDIWRRLKVFKERKVAIQLICWPSERLGKVSTDQIKAMKEVVDDLVIYPIRFNPSSLLRRLWHLRSYSSHVASRILSRAEYQQNFINTLQFRPDAIFLDGIYGGVLGMELSQALRKPLFTRSHNIEHYYMTQQASAAIKISRKIALTLAALHLKDFEYKVLQSSSLFFDISTTDLSFWRSQGLKNGRWLPTIVTGTFDSKIVPEPPIFDVAFLGNLNTPNNIEAVIWLVKAVLPIIVKIRPEFRLAVGGSNPVESVRTLCNGTDNVTFVENPESAFDYYSSAAILVNPALLGSGVNIKSVEMLFTDRPIITTSVGVQGLPDDVKDCFYIADTPDLMAEAVLRIMNEPEPSKGDRQKVRKYFHPDAIIDTIQAMAAFIK